MSLVVVIVTVLQSTRSLPNFYRRPSEERRAAPRRLRVGVDEAKAMRGPPATVVRAPPPRRGGELGELEVARVEAEHRGRALQAEDGIVQDNVADAGGVAV